MEIENDNNMEDGEVKAMGEVEQMTEESNESTEEKIELEDIGKGLILLGGIILLSYFALFVVSALVLAETYSLWSLPGQFAGVAALSVVLIIVGLVIRRITTESERV